MTAADALAGRIASFDSRIRLVRRQSLATAPGETGPAAAGVAPAQTQVPSAALVAAMSAAALAGGLKASRIEQSIPLDARKKEVDGAATQAAEEVFGNAPVNIRVTAGEGERDDSPGALTGQQLGHASPPGGGHPLDGVFDYVDGTGLAAANAPGALALGGLGHRLRPVPDLQAYAVLAPRELLSELDIMSAPEDHAMSVLGRIAAHDRVAISEMTVFTHSLDSNLMHRALIDLLRANVGRLIVPESITVEPPYLLSLAGLSTPRIHSMIGAIGLSELAFAAMLLDLLCPAYAFAFRAGSIWGPRQQPEETTLRPLFRFSAAERQMFAETGLSVDEQYSSLDLLAQGSGVAAAIFAVTDNPLLQLPGPHTTADGVQTEGLLLEPGGRVSRISVFYDLDPG